jgi:hypothetical protein
MLYTYTPETVGGKIIVDTPGGQLYSDQFFVEKALISIKQYVDGLLLIVIQDPQGKTIKVTSNTELNFKKHETDNFYYPNYKEEKKAWSNLQAFS